MTRRLTATWTVGERFGPSPPRIQYHPTSLVLLRYAVEEYHLAAAFAEAIRSAIDEEIIADLVAELHQRQNRSFEYAKKALGVIE